MLGCGLMIRRGGFEILGNAVGFEIHDRGYLPQESILASLFSAANNCLHGILGLRGFEA
jgi:hypothetical protein